MRNILIGAMLISAIAIPAIAQTVSAPEAPGFVSIMDTSVLSSNLVGLNVTNAGDQAIGEIKDIALAADGGVEGYVVSVGGFLGVGEHYVVVEPAAIAISFDPNSNEWRATMNATADQLKAAPAFTYEGKWKS